MQRSFLDLVRTAAAFLQRFVGKALKKTGKADKICVTVRNIALELHMDLDQCYKLAAQNQFNRVVPYHSPEIRCRQSLELYLSCHPSIAQI